MKHFENNVNDGMSRTDSNENTNRELVEQARRKEAEQAAKHVMSIIFGVKKED